MKSNTSIKLYISLIISSFIGLYLTLSYGELKSTQDIVWLDVIAEFGTMCIAATWLVLVLRSRPSGLVTLLLATGLAFFVFSWWIDLLDEFIRMPDEIEWDHWLESLPVPAGFILVSFGIYYWHKEELAIRAQMVKREKVFRDHRLFDAFIPLGSADYLREQIKLALHQAASAHQDISLLVVDLANFSQINLEHGHQEGDKVLQAVTQLLLLNLRDNDLLCHLAGDRFVAVLYDTPNAQANIIADEIRDAIGCFAYRSSQTGQRIFLSAKTVVTETRNTSADDVLKNLNAQLGLEKQNLAKA